MIWPRCAICTRTPRVPRSRSRPSTVSPMIASGLVFLAVKRFPSVLVGRLISSGRGAMVEPGKLEAVEWVVCELAGECGARVPPVLADVRREKPTCRSVGDRSCGFQACGKLWPRLVQIRSIVLGCSGPGRRASFAARFGPSMMIPRTFSWARIGRPSMWRKQSAPRTSI